MVGRHLASCGLDEKKVDSLFPAFKVSFFPRTPTGDSGNRFAHIRVGGAKFDVTRPDGGVISEEGTVRVGWDDISEVVDKQEEEEGG